MWFLLLFLFVFGTIVGSFLNVVILRYGTSLGLGGRSQCFSCGKKLHAHELIPVLSYFFLRGKCSECRARISSQYVWVELLTGLVFALVGYHSLIETAAPTLFVVVLELVAFSLAIAIAVYDARHTIIPDELAVGLATVSLGVLFLRGGGTLDFLSAIGIALFFAAIWYFSKGRAMGLGDAKYAIGLAWLLPWRESISATIIAFWIGAVLGIYLLLGSHRKYTLKSEIPFGPFLALGTLIVYVFHISLVAF